MKKRDSVTLGQAVKSFRGNNPFPSRFPKFHLVSESSETFLGRFLSVPFFLNKCVLKKYGNLIIKLPNNFVSSLEVSPS
jgi:hypothetical protein